MGSELQSAHPTLSDTGSGIQAPDFFPNAQNFVVCGGRFTSNGRKPKKNGAEILGNIMACVIRNFFKFTGYQDRLACTLQFSMTGQELWDAETYIQSISGTLLARNLSSYDPVLIRATSQYHGSYTPWMRRTTGRLCVDLSPSTEDRPIIPTVLPGAIPHIPIPQLHSDQDAGIIASLTLHQFHDIVNHSHEMSLWSSDSLLVLGQMSLGALIYRWSGSEDPMELATISQCVFEDSGWNLHTRGSRSRSKPVRMNTGWTRIDYFNGMSTGMVSRAIHWPRAASCWLPQANYILGNLGIISDYENSRVVDGIDYWVSFSHLTDVSQKGGYLFLCPLDDLRSGDGARFRHPDLASYWSLDPSGTERLSHWKARSLGFPALAFKMKIWARSWNDRVYAGLHLFHQGKGFDPNSQDIARQMGVPLYKSPDEFARVPLW
ncbi:hypothetical protein DFH09DRAFT_1361260 [Mycena vulgaris]|nr:hypothetical protein DFH09DRAFT_1361260 [Mycena vulgaris]